MISMIVIIMVVMVSMLTSVVTVAVAMTVAMTAVIMAFMGMNLSIKMFRLPPDQRWTNRCLNSNASTIFQTPLKNTAEQSINCVVLRASFKVGIKATMTFHGDQRTEIEFTRFKGVSPSTMGTMGKS